jgi:chromate transporter
MIFSEQQCWGLMEGNLTKADMGQRKRASEWMIFLRFLRLGCTSFGGPVAHLGYFRDEFVMRLNWIADETFAEIVALCQSLPGPASSQVGFTIGLMEGGLWGALAAWVGFTLPSAALMFGFAYGHRFLSGRLGTGVLHGLQLAAVAVVAQAVWGMSRTLTPDRRRLLIAAVAAVMVVVVRSANGQLIALAMGAVAGLILCRGLGKPDGEWRVAVSRRVSAVAGVLFVVLLLGLPFWVAAKSLPAVELFSAFYRSGALVFGGGHVVLPLLERVTVARGWVSEVTFLAGYGGAQALPGPLFTFAAYLGAVCAPLPGVRGAVVALVGIFLPGLLLVVAVLPWWNRLRANVAMQAAIAGVNASVVGVLLAALYRPVWTSSVSSVWDVLIVLAGFVLLVLAKVKPLLVVALVALCGAGARLWL